MSKTEWTKKIIIIVIGSIIAAYGITLALYAGFGGATLAVLWQGISRTFHISIGMASLIVAIIMIVFSFFYDRSQIHIGTIIYQLVYSLCVDLFANAHVYSTHLWVNALIMLLGVMLFAVGTGVYAAASLGRGSYEALTFSLAEKNGWQVKAVRMILDIVMVLTGVLLGGKFGICTIVTIIISGPVIQFTASKTKKLLKKKGCGFGENRHRREYPEAVRRLIYTTNNIEGFNRQLRKVTKSKTVFPSDDSLLDMPGNCIIIQTRTESPKRAPSSITNDISYISFFCLHKT